MEIWGHERVKMKYLKYLSIISMKPGTILLATLFLSILISPALATDSSFSTTITFTNAFGLIVPLGIESAVPTNWVLPTYNFIAIGILFIIAGFAARRNVRFALVSIDALAAVFWWFGWMSMYNPTTGEINSTTPLSLIILVAVLCAAVFLKEANRENFGVGKPGSTLLNILYYFILLQTAVGFVNATGIWTDNTSSASFTEYQYDNVDLSAQMYTQSNQGGLLEGLLSTIYQLNNMAVQALETVLKIINGIAGYPTIITTAFPWVQQSLLAMAFIGCLSVIILLLDVWFIFLMLFKPPAFDNIGVG